MSNKLQSFTPSTNNLETITINADGLVLLKHIAWSSNYRIVIDGYDFLPLTTPLNGNSANSYWTDFVIPVKKGQIISVQRYIVNLYGYK